MCTQARSRTRVYIRAIRSFYTDCRGKVTMPIFSFRTTPLPSLRTYTIFSVVVLCVSVLLLRHHPDEEPPTHQVASNKPDNETENANSDESAVFSKWVLLFLFFRINKTCNARVSGCHQYLFLRASLVEQTCCQRRLRQAESRRRAGNRSQREVVMLVTSHGTVYLIVASSREGLEFRVLPLRVCLRCDQYTGF